MASVGFGTVAPAMATPAGRRVGRLPARRPFSARIIPAATKSGTTSKVAQQEEKSLFDLIFGPMYKEEQLLETDPILNKVEGKAPTAPVKASATTTKKADDGGFCFGGLFAKKG